MEREAHDDAEILLALGGARARVLLIGRRAMVALGLPVVTADYDVWIHIDDVEKLNDALGALDFVPNRTPAEARQRDRYVLEDGDHIDVMVARAKSAPTGEELTFDDAWARRQSIDLGAGAAIFLPSLDDLIVTKRWGSRPRDLIDIEHLEALRRSS